MMLIDAVIPGVIGVVCMTSPATMLFGSRVTPTPEKLDQIRKIGKGLMLVATAFVAISIFQSLGTA